MSASMSRRRFLGGADPAENGEAVAVVSEGCFAAKGIYCRSCGDICPERAIRFNLQTGGRATVAIDAELCTACGDCAPVCPASAISIPHVARPQTPEASHA
jgi:NAD-dependent dihydropyrimidine dehydrogenase PreA subunit